MALFGRGLDATLIVVMHEYLKYNSDLDTRMLDLDHKFSCSSTTYGKRWTDDGAQDLDTTVDYNNLRAVEGKRLIADVKTNLKHHTIHCISAGTPSSFVVLSCPFDEF